MLVPGRAQKSSGFLKLPGWHKCIELVARRTFQLNEITVKNPTPQAYDEWYENDKHVDDSVRHGFSDAPQCDGCGALHPPALEQVAFIVSHD